MSRILAIDFGERRIGLALCDPEERMAFPHQTLERSSDAQALKAIAHTVEEEEVDEIVLGDPLLLDGSAGPMAQRVRSFRDKLVAAVPLPVRLVPETLTSVEAQRRLREAGVDLRRHSQRIDAVAAQILLEEVIAERRRAPPVSTAPPQASGDPS